MPIPIRVNEKINQIIQNASPNEKRSGYGIPSFIAKKIIENIDKVAEVAPQIQSK